MKKLFVNFIKDKLVYTLLFFLNSFFLILFFYLTKKGRVELVYPLIIVIFMYIIFFLIEYFRYYSFHKKLNKCVNNFDYDLELITNQQQKIGEIIDKIHKKYIRQIQEMKINIKEQKRFLSQLIHNIKTPVSVIDLILQSNPQSKDSKWDDIQEENNKIYKLLDNVLNIIRLDDFSQDFVTEQIDLIEQVKNIINQRKNQFIHQHIYPRLKLEVEEAVVYTDSKWNKVMLDQIVSNAIKYSAVKGGEKEVVFSITSTENKIDIKIIDKGIGIPQYDLEKVFDPFFTGENGRHYSNSTGIGLYISSKIAAKLGHEISINSKINKGTEVIVSYYK